MTKYVLFTRLLNPFHPVIFSSFYILFRNILQFISQHFTVYFPTSYLFMSQHLSVHFANILLVYSSAFIHLNLIFYQHFNRLFYNVTLLFFRFYSSLKNWEVSSFQTKFRQGGYFEVPHLVPKGQFFYFSYYLFSSLCFFLFLFCIFLFVVIFIFIFIIIYFYSFILFMSHKVLVHF